MIRRTAGVVPSILIGASLFALAACSDSDVPVANQTGPVKVQGTAIRSADKDSLPGTPMAERTAVVGLLNKRNGLTRDLTLKPGEAVRVGDAIVRLQACETSAPWENVQDTGAFVQLDVRSSADGKWRRNFSGWLFRDRPDRNVVQHPIYDIWVRSCAMAWPESGPETVTLGAKGEPASARPASGANASSAAAPEPEPSAPAPSAASPTATPSN
ncbi:hypothetical protein J2W40_003472 [Sphingobium xenophagum]|uniref:DUF2155 domain-containing protein n=1 Tax=Sphingobium xenophagum TaxID=121428 RepID=A0ABU1X4X9_SPHXE|nr:hypothetical protein [Sphingobium xenophagum]